METDNYFKAYADLNIHQLMLKDLPRIRAYRQAINDNIELFQGKTVLDVGAGTGILSIFCAKAGAKRIFAIEASDIYQVAEEIVIQNQLEGVIKVIHSKVEDLSLLIKADVIVSEWMGFYLLHEAMLDSLIYARDNFLKPNGYIFPESATLYSAPCSVPDMFDYWNNIEGVSMRKFAQRLREEASHKPITNLVSANDILSEPEVVLWIDLREVTSTDLDTIRIQHIAVAKKNGSYQGICLWFTCVFPSTITVPVVLSTAPEDAETHWKQTTIILPSEIHVEENAPIAYDLVLSRSLEDDRRYNMEVTMLDPSEVSHPEDCQCYYTKCILVRAMLEKYEIKDE